MFPFIGHMGICTSAGIIRDFAGPYFVSHDKMGFGEPTKYWQLDESRVHTGSWDQAVQQASDEYMTRMVSIFFVICFSIMHKFALFFSKKTCMVLKEH